MKEKKMLSKNNYYDCFTDYHGSNWLQYGVQTHLNHTGSLFLQVKVNLNITVFEVNI